MRPRVGGVASEFRACVYATDVEDTEYLALVLGDVKPDEPVLVRVQTASVLRDVFGVGAADDDHPATVPLRMIEEAGKGILLYVFPRGRASLVDDFGRAAPGRGRRAGRRGVERAALRDFGLGAQVLAHLGAQHDPPADQQPAAASSASAATACDVVECVPIRPPRSVVRAARREAAR